MSRAEIETLCLLYVIGSDGCSIGDVAAKLGLSPALARHVREALRTLVSSGHVVVNDERVHVTDEGAAWVRARVADVDGV